MKTMFPDTQTHVDIAVDEEHRADAAHRAQAREQVEPFERVTPIPKFVFALIAGVLVWAVAYIVLSSPKDAPELGDKRTLSALGGPAPAQAGALVDGAQVFSANCAACHQATGLGIAGAFPPLAASEWVLGSPKVLTQILLHGVDGNLTVLGKTYAGQMPAFKEKLSDAEIAAVATHIRNQWGNSSAPVAAALVEEQRKATSDRSAPYKGDAELAALPKE
jgi:mono/diheme cytochrome c family protein